MELLEGITVEPGKCGGSPCIRGMRVRVKDVLDMLAEGATPAQILTDSPDLEAEDIRACLAYAAGPLYGGRKGGGGSSGRDARSAAAPLRLGD